MTEEYGDEDLSLWVDESCDFPKVKRDSFFKWKDQMNKEISMYRGRASHNIIDQLYPADYSVFFEYFWGKYLSSIYKKPLAYWIDNLKFIADRIRNPEMHSRKNLLSPRKPTRGNINMSGNH